MYKIPFSCLSHLLLIKYVLWFSQRLSGFHFSSLEKGPPIRCEVFKDLMPSLKRWRGGGAGTPNYAEMSILYDTKRGKNLINGNAKQGLIDYFTIIARPTTLSTAAIRRVLFKSFLTCEDDTLTFNIILKLKVPMAKCFQRFDEVINSNREALMNTYLNFHHPHPLNILLWDISNLLPPPLKFDVSFETCYQIGVWLNPSSLKMRELISPICNLFGGFPITVAYQTGCLLASLLKIMMAIHFANICISLQNWQKLTRGQPWFVEAMLTVILYPALWTRVKK